MIFFLIHIKSFAIFASPSSDSAFYCGKTATTFPIADIQGPAAHGLSAYLLALDREALRPVDFFSGTFVPSFLASERPIAMACLRLFTGLPLLPLLSVPSCISFIDLSTLSPAFFEYFAIKWVLLSLKKSFIRLPRPIFSPPNSAHDRSFLR